MLPNSETPSCLLSAASPCLHDLSGFFLEKTVSAARLWGAQEPRQQLLCARGTACLKVCKTFPEEGFMCVWPELLNPTRIRNGSIEISGAFPLVKTNRRLRICQEVSRVVGRLSKRRTGCSNLRA